MATDGELVQQARGGDKDAFAELVARYQGHVYGLAYSLVGNWAYAQDIAQETFIRAYANLDQLREAARFPAWLRRVSFSVAMNWVKAHRPQRHRQIDGRNPIRSAGAMRVAGLCSLAPLVSKLAGIARRGMDGDESALVTECIEALGHMRCSAAADALRSIMADARDSEIADHAGAALEEVERWTRS